MPVDQVGSRERSTTHIVVTRLPHAAVPDQLFQCQCVVILYLHGRRRFEDGSTVKEVDRTI